MPVWAVEGTNLSGKEGMFPAFQQGPFLHPLTPPALAIVQEGVGFTVSTASEVPMPISSPWAFLVVVFGLQK